MPKISIASLNVDELLELRQNIDRRLGEQRKELENTLSRLGGGSSSSAASRRDPRKRSHLLGEKIAAKYRGPGGETWAGRGATPRWIRESGKPAEAFLIKKPSRKAA